MKTIAVTGASGLIGSALCAHLTACGYTVLPLPRVSADGEVGWNPATGAVRLPADARADAVIHLAGESVAGLWTAQKKHRILASRVEATHKLAQFLAASSQPPQALFCASAIGIYGNQGDTILDETSAAGSGFLAEVTTGWENAATPAREAGIRVAHLRFGVVLSRHGGALAAMLPPFRFGLGAVVGSGEQWQSWISLEDTVRAIVFVLEKQLSGPVNIVAPHAATNAQLTHALGAQLKRPTFLRIPAFAIRAALGQAANQMLLSSAHVLPRVLEHQGFEWKYPHLEVALAHEL